MQLKEEQKNTLLLNVILDHEEGHTEGDGHDHSKHDHNHGESKILRLTK